MTDDFSQCSEAGELPTVVPALLEGSSECHTFPGSSGKTAESVSYHLLPGGACAPSSRTLCLQQLQEVMYLVSPCVSD